MEFRELPLGAIFKCPDERNLRGYWLKSSPRKARPLEVPREAARETKLLAATPVEDLGRVPPGADGATLMQTFRAGLDVNGNSRIRLAVYDALGFVVGVVAEGKCPPLWLELARKRGDVRELPDVKTTPSELRELAGRVAL